MTEYTMNIATHDEDNQQARIIIEVNGHEIDILADGCGLSIEVKKGEAVATSCGMDWEA